MFTFEFVETDDVGPLVKFTQKDMPGFSLPAGYLPDLVTALTTISEDNTESTEFFYQNFGVHFKNRSYTLVKLGVEKIPLLLLSHNDVTSLLVELTRNSFTSPYL